MEKGLKDIPKVDLNDYEKGEEIGSGGFGRVYLVEHKVTKKKYAAKVNIVKDDIVKYVMREIGILSDVHFPTIVNFIGVSLKDFDGNPNATVLLEYYEKGSVNKVFKELDSTSRHIILTGVAHGLKILHSLNIIHRDIKPDNVLLDEHLHPYITDFGLSKHFDPEDPTNQTMHGGSPNYMAPEIIRKEAYDNSVDAYAFGILMYEVIVGHRAFYNVYTGQRPRFDPKEKINEQLKKLCAACWDENPNERPIFEDIYNALSLKENNDYLLDGANAEEVKKYVEFIENNGTQVDQVKMKELQLEILRAQEPYIKLQDDIKRIRKSSTSKTAFTKKLSAKQSGKNTDNGILYLLKKQEEKNDNDDEICDPLFYPSLSSRDPYDVLLPNWIGFYNSSDTGKFFFELQLQGVIYLTGFIIQSSDKGIPKSYQILVNNHKLIEQNEDEQMRDKQYVVIRLKRPVACNQFKFVQTGPNWDGKQYIRLKRIELYTREHPLDENPFPKNKGFFDTYKSLHRTDFNPHLLPVKISTDVFSCEQVENVKTNQVVGTNHGLNEFCEFKFTKGLVTIDSYRLKRLKDRDTLKGWDVIGIKTNGDNVVISSIKEENIDDHKLLDYYPSNDNKTKFQSIRIKNTTENWNGEIKKVLKFHHFDFFGDYYE